MLLGFRVLHPSGISHLERDMMLFSIIDWITLSKWNKPRIVDNLALKETAIECTFPIEFGYNIKCIWIILCVAHQPSMLQTSIPTMK
ncbi:MAG: hypothetical protein BroJett011_29610 [Chloroflexota bacterium]|nr:MAG: hypothetical protein BroJett011_29610 [Chloroflexota bacterium]